MGSRDSVAGVWEGGQPDRVHSFAMTIESLYEPAVNAAVVGRIESLGPDTQPSWGKMNVVQMLAHCQKPLLVASGELHLKRGLIGKLFGRAAKKRYIDSDAPFSKDGPTDPRFLVPDANDFAREQAGLVALVRRFGEKGPETGEPHPFFGPLTREEWDRLQWKHLDHHLRQFGV